MRSPEGKRDELVAANAFDGTYFYAIGSSALEALVDEAPAMMMKPHDAAVLERARGYADIEPALAWEQWQIVREQLGHR